MLKGVANVRDVGGMPARDGEIRAGVLMRSASLGGLPGLGGGLAALGVGTVVDLRTDAEQQQSPDDLPDVQLVSLPLLQGAWDPRALDGSLDPGTPLALPNLSTLYEAMIGDGGKSFATLAGIVAGSTRAVLVHCTAGKDRTGVAVAVLLDAVGADRAAVIADYAASQGNLTGAWADGVLAMLARVGIAETPGLSDLITASPASAITAVLDSLDAAGGSLNYLRGNGLSDDDAHRLRDRLVEA